VDFKAFIFFHSKMKHIMIIQ